MIAAVVVFYNDGGEFIHVGKEQMELARRVIHQMFPGHRRIPFGVKNRQYVLRGRHVERTTNEIGIHPVDFDALPDPEDYKETVDLREKNDKPEEEEEGWQKVKKKKAPQVAEKIPIELRIEEEETPLLSGSSRASRT